MSASLDGIIGRDAIETTADVQQAIAVADGGITTTNVTATTLNTNLMTITNDQITPLGSSTDIILNTSTTGAFKIDNLRVKTNAISSTNTDGDIILAPNGAGKVTTDNLALDGNTISSTNTDGDIVLAPNGAGTVKTDNLQLDGNTLSSTNTDGDIVLQPNGNGKVTTDNLALDGNTLSSTNTDGDIVLQPNGNGKVTTDNLALDGNTISSTNTDGNIVLAPNGTGNIVLGTMTLNADQTVSASEDDYVLKYDHSTGTIGLEAEAGGGSSLWTQSGSDIYYNSGKVAINKTTSSANLEIAPTSGQNALIINGDSGTGHSQLALQGSTYGAYIQTNNTNGSYHTLSCINGSNATLFKVQNSGRVVVGLSSGTVGKLQVSGFFYGSVPRNYFTTHSSGSNIVTQPYTGSTFAYSAYFSNAIGANGIGWTSDERIKTEISVVDDAWALQKVRDIECKEYHYKDPLLRKEQKTIGYIAQDVQQHLPQAVSQITDYVPDELRPIENITWVPVDGGFKVVIPNVVWKEEHTRMMKFYVTLMGEEEIKLELKADENNAVIFEKQYATVFLYGKEVNNFLQIAKDKIYSLHHSAIQEIDRRQTADKEHIKLLEARLAHLEQRLNSANI